jgi:hypothetical protein
VGNMSPALQYFPPRQHLWLWRLLNSTELQHTRHRSGLSAAFLTTSRKRFRDHFTTD